MNYTIKKNWKKIGVVENRRKKEEKIDYTVYRFSKKEWFQVLAEYMGIVSIIDILCYRSIYVYFLALPFAVFFVRWKKKEKIFQRKQHLSYHFADALRGLQTGIRAGRSMEQSIKECRKELQQIYGEKDDIVKEFIFIEQQMSLGVPVEQLFLEFGKRSGVEDIKGFGEIFLISRRTGGNLGKIMDKITQVLGKKIFVDREIQTELSGKILEQKVMSIVPGIMIFYVQITSKGSLDSLYHNIVGNCIMTVCLILYVVSFMIGRKIVRIQV